MPCFYILSIFVRQFGRLHHFVLIISATFALFAVIFETTKTATAVKAQMTSTLFGSTKHFEYTYTLTVMQCVCIHCSAPYDLSQLVAKAIANIGYSKDKLVCRVEVHSTKTIV